MVTGYKRPGESADYAGQWPSDWIDQPETCANVPAGARRTRARRCCKTFSSAHVERAARRSRRVQGDDVPDPGRDGSRSTCACAARTCRPSVPFETDANGNPLADMWTNAASDPDGCRPERRPTTVPDERQPADSVHGRRHDRLRRLPGAPGRATTASKYVELRRRGVGGPVVLQQPDLHRGQGLDASSPA